MSYEITVQSPFFSAEVNAEISSCLADLCAGLPDVLAKYPLEPFMDQLYRAHHRYDYSYMPEAILKTFSDIEAEFGIDTVGRYNKVVTLHLISRFENIVRAQRVPPEFHEELPRTLLLLWESLRDAANKDYVYPEDFYFKDIRILTGRSFVQGSMLTDHGIYLPQTIYRNNGWYDNLRCLWYLATRTRGLGPFFRPHVDIRFVQHRSEDERRKRRIRDRILRAELMKLNPEARGFISSGWLEDPKLHLVSPRYAHNFQIGIEQKVFRVCDGPSEQATANAIATSKTRREAYERGEYKPLNYTKITPRSGIIKWARKNRHLIED